MAHFPIFINLQDRPCLVVGAGAVAARKIAQLLEHGAQVCVVAPQAVEQVTLWADQGSLTFLTRPFTETDLDGRFIVVAATNDRAVNAAVFRAAEKRRILCNVVDDPEICSFIYPAIVKRGDLQIAISTSGAFPALAKSLKTEIDELLAEECTQYIDILAQVRVEAMRQVADPEARKKLYLDVLNMDLLSLIRSGQTDLATRKALECISRSSD